MPSSAPALQLLVCFLLVSCSTSRLPTQTEVSRASLSSFAWPARNYAKVVGFRYDSTSRNNNILSKQCAINVTALQQAAVAKTELSSSQICRLLTATLRPAKASLGMRCYFPHHDFDFYSKSDTPVAAIEVCFACQVLRTSPRSVAPPASDYIELAKLADDLGLWDHQKVSLKQFIREATSSHKPNLFPIQ